MSLKRRIQLPSLTSVAANKTALLQLPLNYRYHAIMLACTAYPTTSGKKISSLPTAWINDIRVRMNGRIQRTHSAAQLAKLNAVNGSAYGATTIGFDANDSDYGQVLPIYFAEPWREDQPQKEFGAVPGKRLTDFAVEIDIGSPADNNSSPAASPPTITAYAIVDTEDQPGAERNGLVVGKVFRQSIAAGASGSVTVDLNTLDRRDLYQAIHVQLGSTPTPVAASTTRLSTVRATLKSSGLTIYDLYQDVELATLAQMGLNATRQFDISIVLDSDDPIQSGLNANGLPDLQLRLESGNVSGTPNATWTILSERMGPPE